MSATSLARMPKPDKTPIMAAPLLLPPHFIFQSQDETQVLQVLPPMALLAIPYRASAGAEQGQNRVFSVKFFSQGKTCVHYRKPSFSHCRDHVFITGISQGKEFTGKNLFSLQKQVCSAFQCPLHCCFAFLAEIQSILTKDMKKN